MYSYGKNKLQRYTFHLGDRSRIFDTFKITGGSQKIQSKLWDFYSNLGDLEESRTPIDGMKTRCTNRYTTRPENV